MAFYKWKAYDFDVKYHDGVIEAARFEEVVLVLANKNLVPSSIEEIEYHEYIQLRNAAKKLEKLKLRVKKLNNKPSKQSINNQAKKSKSFNYMVVFLLIVIIFLLILK